MRASIRPVVATLISVGAVFAAASAQADVVNTPCGASELTCSNGAAALKAESRDTILTTADSGWWPKCDPTEIEPDGYCGKLVQAKVTLDLAAYPAPAIEPLWMVDMGRGAVVDARWPTDQAFELTVPTATTKEGTFKIDHTIIPQVHLRFQVLGIKFPYTYDATPLVNNVAKKWNYRASKAVDFLPWAIASEPPVVNLVPAPASASTPLFDMRVYESENGDWKIDLGLTAATNPEFSYRTTKVTLSGQSPITNNGESAKLPMVDADYLDVPAIVEGEITVKGTFDAKPFGVAKYKAVTVPIDVPITGIAYTEEKPIAVKFPATTVRIPLPNVKAPKSLVDLGRTQIGNPSTTNIEIKNTGEMGASLTFESDNPLFTVPEQAGVQAKTDYPLAVTFSPNEEGSQEATITVTSNDPDSPVQTFKVQAYGTLEAVEDDEGGRIPGGGDADDGDDLGVGAADSGCGCRTAPAPSSFGALGGLGLMALFFARRRRNGKS